MLIKWSCISWGFVRKTEITLGISNREDLMQGVGYSGVRDLKTQRGGQSILNIRNAGSSNDSLVLGTEREEVMLPNI